MDELSEGIGKSGRRNSEAESEEDYPAKRHRSNIAAKLLLRSGANVNQVDKTGRTALFVHCEKSNGIEAILELLEHGASINLKDRNGLTPLHVACQRGLKLTVKLLLQKGASVNEVDKHGETPMFIACRRQSQHGGGLLTALLQHGALVNIKNDEGETALHVACRNLRMDACFLLVRYGADVNELNDKHESPLLLAVQPSCPKDLIWFLLMGPNADIDTKNAEGQTPLHVACSKGITHLVKLLLRRGSLSE